MATSFFVQSSTIGVDLNNGSATQLFALGTHCLGTQDSEWVYVQANTSIVGNSMVAFNTAFTCGMASGLDVTNGLSLGTAQTSISSQAFGWVAIRGVGLTVLGTGTVSVAGLFLGASALATGVLSNQNSGSCTLAGVVLQATASGSASSGTYLVNLSWPRGFAAGL